MVSSLHELLEAVHAIINPRVCGGVKQLVLSACHLSVCLVSVQ